MQDNSKIILDVDTGTDDAMAIIIAMRMMRERLLGITVTHGNQPLKYTLENTLRVVELMGGGVPVYAGCAEPMVQNLMPGRKGGQRHQGYSQVIDGKTVCVHDEYLDLPKAALKPEKQHAVSFLVETLRDAAEPITLIAVGPATNVAMALRMDASIAKNIKQLIVMGGGMEGVNITSAAEFNFFHDPEAAQIMLKAECPIVIFPLDATTSVMFTKEDAAKIAAIGNKWSVFYADLIVHFLERLRVLNIALTDDPDFYGVTMHDAFCVMYLLDPSFIKVSKKKNVDVDYGGSFCDGRLVVDNRVYEPLQGDVTVVYELDKEKILDQLTRYLS